MVREKKNPRLLHFIRAVLAVVLAAITSQFMVFFSKHPKSILINIIMNI